MLNSDKILELKQLINEFETLGLNCLPDYENTTICSLVTMSAALDGSTVTEEENMRVLKSRVINARGRTHEEMMLNFTLWDAYERSIRNARNHRNFDVAYLFDMSTNIMFYKDLLKQECGIEGTHLREKVFLFQTEDAKPEAEGDALTLLEVMCNGINQRRGDLADSQDIIDKYVLSFDAHYYLWLSHAWLGVEGRICRLVMNQLQYEFGLIPTVIRKERKEEYLNSLKKCEWHNSYDPFRNFMIEEHIWHLHYAIDQHKLSYRLSEKMMKAYEEVRIDGHRSYEEFADALNISGTTVKRRLNELKKGGYIQRVGSNKTGYWEILMNTDSLGKSESDDIVNDNVKIV